MKIRLLGAVCGAALGLSLASAGPTAAQAPADAYQEAVPPPEPYETTNNKAIDRRLDRSEKALRELRSIVLKAQAQGVPVEIKPAGPDPVLNDLQRRFSDLDATTRQLTGQMETLRYDLEQAKAQAADAQGQSRALAEQLQQMQAAAVAAAAPPPEGGLATTDPGAPPAPEAAAPAGTEAESYQQARARLDSGDYAGAADAMQVFIQRYPNSSRVPTAYYWMGRSYGALNQAGQAAGAFAQSLKGWPQTSWAADATVQLANALVAVKRTGDACKALAEFDSRYAAKASANLKSVAATTRTTANCR